MGKLLNLKDLEGKYGSFSKPSLKLIIDDKEFKSDDILIMNVRTESTTGFEASVATIEARSCETKYEKKELKIDPNLDKYFALGKKIEICMGYGAKTESVFLGNINSVSVNYHGESEVTYSVEAMDVKAMMMHNCISEVKKDIKKYSAAVVNVLEQYSQFYKDKKIDQTPDLTVPIEQYNQSDYEFIVSLAKILGFLFYVVAGTVYFIAYNSIKDVSVSLPASYIISNIEKELTLSGQCKSVIVRGNNDSDPTKPFEATASDYDNIGEGSKKLKDLTKVLDNDRMQVLVVDNSLRSQEEATARAKAELLKRSMNLLKGKADLNVGVPDIVPGKFVEFKDINDQFNGKCFVNAVTHEMDGNSFRTTFRWEANVVC